ncbi:MAG: 23S rRNA (uracil(1939)-C(5))-methyltransferase RlmD [Oscillospiraceae bacterium]
MILKKNDIVNLEITGMTSEGNGVGKYEGMAVFVPMTAVGDVISARITKAQKSFSYGIVEEIITPSKYRICADCQVFAKCGGCSFRHITYAAELLVKGNFVKDAFKRIGKFTIKPLEIIGSEENYYRNKAQYPVANADGKAICGFYAKRSHRVIPFTACKLQPKIFQEITDYIINFVNINHIPAYDEEKQTGILRHIYLRQGYHSQEIMVCLVVTKDVSKQMIYICNGLVENFPNIKSVLLNINAKNTNVILGSKNIFLCGNRSIFDTMCGNKIALSPFSFYQINTAQAERLYGIIADFSGLNGDESLMDLYCGAGTIGLYLSKNVKELLGVEVVEQAVKNATENAALNKISNAKFICGDAGEVSEKLAADGKTPDIIVVDPPRKGCDEATLSAILKMLPNKLVMVSCNPSTAARDCEILAKGGYALEKIQPVDMFPRTNHVECVVLMSRVSK